MKRELEETQEFLEKEQQAEWETLPFVYGVSFTDCLRMHGVETERVVGEHRVMAHRIYGQWSAFLVSIGEVWAEGEKKTTRAGNVKAVPKGREPVLLTGKAERLMEQMFAWITTKKSEVYQGFASGEEATWLRLVLRFTVYRRIMEAKYKQWFTTGQGFADPVVGSRIAEVYRFGSEMSSVARLVRSSILTHKDREPEDWEKRLAEEIIAGIFSLLRADRLRSLPPLPKAAKLVEQEKEDA